MNASPDLPDDQDAPDLSQAGILIVDDNLQNLELMQAYLEELGCSISTATDGLEAIEAIDADKPDLVLLDVMMPRMSGFEVCQKIKAQPTTKDVIIIMVTALNEVGDFERAVDCGTDDYIAKPVNKLELLTKVQSLLEHRLLLRSCDQLGLRDHVPTPDFGVLTDEGDTILPPPEDEEFEGESPRAPRF
ncbi:MAG: two-component system response regulator [Phycisphaerae bacterium]|nr:two-component system response regulator [Phycisphaerae bacterium]HBZ97567.1 two-component system response regulator [Phycisphaerales bacterium]